MQYSRPENISYKTRQSCIEYVIDAVFDEQLVESGNTFQSRTV